MIDLSLSCTQLIQMCFEFPAWAKLLAQIFAEILLFLTSSGQICQVIDVVGLEANCVKGRLEFGLLCQVFLETGFPSLLVRHVELSGNDIPDQKGFFL